MNQYEELFQALLVSPNNELTVSVNITPSNLRKGLKVALDTYNVCQEMLGDTEETRKVTISTLKVDSSGEPVTSPTFKVALADPSKSKFTFTILPSEEDTTNESEQDP